MTCQNNLKQLGLAAANYESANGCLAPGVNNNSGTSNGGGYSGSMAGTLAYLLPYVEQDNVYKTFGQGTWTIPSTAGYYSGTATVSIKTYLCPSDNAAGAPPANGPFPSSSTMRAR